MNRVKANSPRRKSVGVMEEGLDNFFQFPAPRRRYQVFSILLRHHEGKVWREEEEQARLRGLGIPATSGRPDNGLHLPDAFGHIRFSPNFPLSGSPCPGRRKLPTPALDLGSRSKSFWPRLSISVKSPTSASAFHLWEGSIETSFRLGLQQAL